METTHCDGKKRILIVEDQFIEAHDLQLILENAGYLVSGIARSVAQAIELIEEEKPDLVFLDIFLKGNETGIDLAKRLKENHIGFIYISANSSRTILDEAKKTQPYGFIVKPFREQDVLITLEIACYRHKHSLESLLHQKDILQKNIDAITFNPMKWEQALFQIGRAIQTYIPFDYMESGFIDKKSKEYNITGLLRKNFDDYQIISPEKFSRITAYDLKELTELLNNSPKHEKATIYNGDSFAKISKESATKRIIIQTFGIKSFIAIPVVLEDGEIFNFFFYSRHSDSYANEHLSLLMNIESILAKFVKAMYITSPVSVGKPEKEMIQKVYSAPSQGFEGMIGNSKKMFSVFDYIKKVAPSDTSVLILGESGTGKEKVAQCIHNLSPRKQKPLVIINCGAIPDNLAESLLFGHEKGAFTGAIDKRIGKFELADGGTVFLDEIGEMPIELQVKLLRVLQEKEIERIGGRSPIKIDVRIIAATNRNLEEEVAVGRFRLDLYYRLHIFPIMVPSLRERKEDIASLVSHFVSAYSEKVGRKSLSMSNDVMQQLLTYDWPGNIRELEHLIQRSILLSEGNVIKDIHIPKLYNEKGMDRTEEFSIKTIHENERDYISYILKKCKGKVSGIGGAAELLDIPPSTLNSKIKKLGIKNNTI